MEKLVSEIINWTEDSSQESKIIRISGHGAAGKTTFAEYLCSLMKEGTFNYLNTDPYIIEGRYRRQLEAVYEYNNKQRRYKPTACLPSAHELSSLERDIKVLKSGGEIYTIGKSWQTEMKLHGKRSVSVVEGMSAAFIDASLFDLSVYIYTDSRTELRRRLKRDVNERGRSMDNLYQSHEERRIQYELFMHPESEHFDILINDSDNRFQIERSCIEGRGLE